MIQTMKAAQEAANQHMKVAEDISDWIDDAVWLVDAASDIASEAEPMGHPLHGPGFWISEAEYKTLAEALNRINRK